MDPDVRSHSAAASDRARASGHGGYGNGHSDPAEGPAPADAFKEVAARLGEAKEYVSHYLAAKLDGIKLSVRNLGVYIALGLLGALAGAAVVITATVLFITGLAGAIGAMFNPDRPWAGSLILGFVLLAAVAGGVVFGLKKLTGTWYQSTVKKYETRQRDQRLNYGHDVRERAREVSERP